MKKKMLADAFDPSLNCLTGSSDLESDKQILERIRKMSLMPDNDRKQIFLIIDAFIKDFNSQR